MRACHKPSIALLGRSLLWSHVGGPVGSDVLIGAAGLDMYVNEQTPVPPFAIVPKQNT
jgi:hypothetical protein